MDFYRRRHLRRTATAFAAIAVGLLPPTAEARPRADSTLPTSHVVGGTLTFETTGTLQLITLLFVSSQEGEQLLQPYGSLFVGTPLHFFPFAVIPDTTNLAVPGNAPVGVEVVFQELAFELFSGNGNFSNVVSLVIE